VDATKIEIRKAVEALYKVNVVAVRTVRNLGKIVRRGRISGQRNRSKKAFVTLKAGQKIDLYEGV
jgi:large subunit ribosomal protein L23